MNGPQLESQNYQDENSPLLGHHEGSAGEDTTKSAPLLIRWFNSVKNCIARNPYSFAVGFALMVLFGFHLWLFATKGSRFYQEAMIVNIQHVTLEEFTDKGIEISLKGSLFFDYNMINNSYYRLCTVLISTLVGTVKVCNPSVFDVFLKLGDTESDKYQFHRISNLQLPETVIDLTDKKINDIDIEQSFHIFEHPINQLGEDILRLWTNHSHPDEILFTARASGNLNMATLSLHVGNFSVAHDITLSFGTFEGDLEDYMEIDQISISDQSGSYQVETSATLSPLNYPLKASIPRASFQVSIWDCEEEELVPFANLSMDQLVLKPYEELVVSSTLTVSELDSRLTSNCPSTNRSPLNELIIGFLSGEKSLIYIYGSNNAANEDVPKWLRSVLEGLVFPIDSSIISPLLKKFTPDLDFLNPTMQFKEIGLHSIDSDSQPHLNAKFYGNVTLPAYANLSSLNISGFTSTFEISEAHKNVVKVNIEEWQDSSTIIDHDVLYFEGIINDSLIDIISPETISHMIQKYLDNHSQVVDVDATIGIQAQTPVSEQLVELSDLEVQLPIELAGPSTDIDSVLDHLNVTVLNINVISTTKDSILLLVDADILNPFASGFNLVNVDLDLQIAYNESTLGHLSLFENIESLGSSWFSASALFDIDPNRYTIDNIPSSDISPIEKLEQLVSGYLSGEETLVTIEGHDRSIPTSPLLSQVLKNLSVTLPIPQIVYDEHKILSSNPDYQSGFILDSTMHLMSSEIEFTVYNPISNSEAFVLIENAKASYEGTVLGYIGREQSLIIPPGVSTTPRIPIRYATSGIGADILRKAMNGELKVDAQAVVEFGLQSFKLQLIYHGKGMRSNIRL
ncbi:BA75_04065T0 [Komagataella pastoris]|uniref:BA75_04065T0 n=1 Tax=Komagataella pastoris TaxID=4922 RepID=A0A1B2JGE1_PICPA|nr:BA75_04065T0 [Komagataella pastoris]